jgi:thiol:disulfide interchange protein DsbD
VFCFNLFAIIIIALQQSGQQVGWGFHMQEPVVVLLLAFLFTFIALILLDAMPVSGRFSGVGQSLVSGDTAKSHFATGALAVIVASPCTAPFMAAALGVALVSEPYVSFLLFNALALGFALPLTLLFMSKRALALLPKPGQWMLTFKHILAFPMLITVAWLCWVYAGQLGTQAQFILLLGLILFCMFAWLLGRSTKALSKIIYTFAIILCIALPLWLSITMPNVTSATINQSVAYESFDTNRLAELRNDNKVVVVNMTADWCITCKVNEQIAFVSDDVKAALANSNVQYVVGDWTNKNDEILQYLTQYERAGVPLYVVYAGNKSKQVLPQILTPNIIIDAIEQAKKELNNEN